jgi:hypothetical protein
MPTPKEFRKNAEDCLRLAYETDEIYARLLLIEMATEFRVMAAHLEREAKRRTTDRISQQVDALRRAVTVGYRARTAQRSLDRET